MASTPAGAPPKCGRTQEKLDELKARMKKGELDYDDYFFNVEDEKGKCKKYAEKFGVKKDDGYDRCIKCGRTIDEHSSSAHSPNDGTATYTGCHLEAGVFPASAGDLTPKFRFESDVRNLIAGGQFDWGTFSKSMEDARNGTTLLFWGPSGRGKSFAARFEVANAMLQSRVAQGVFVASATLSSPSSLDLDTKQTRNERAKDIALKHLNRVTRLQETAVEKALQRRDPLVLIIDECHIDDALCRGLTANLHALRQAIRTQGWGAFVLVLAGFAFENEELNAYASDTSRVGATFVSGLSVEVASADGMAIKRVGGGHVAAYMVARELVRRICGGHDESATQREWHHIMNDIAQNHCLALVFELAGENMACIKELWSTIQQYFAEEETPREAIARFVGRLKSDANAGYELQAKFSKALTQRNGLCNRTLDAGDVKRILMVARKQRVTRDELAPLSAMGIMFGERVESSSEYIVHIEPIYFHYLMQQMARPCPNAFQVNPEQFEADVVAECLLGAVSACKDEGQVTLGQLLRGVQWGSDEAAAKCVWETRPDVARAFSHVHTIDSQVASINDAVTVGWKDGIPPEGVYLNAKFARFADVILVLPKAVVLVQVKLSLKMVHAVAADESNKIDWGSAESGASYYDEAAKCGCPVLEHCSNRYPAQRELVDAWAKSVGADNVYFVLWTNKQVGKKKGAPSHHGFRDAVHDSPHHGIVSHDTFDEATAPYQLYYRAISRSPRSFGTCNQGAGHEAFTG